jgi:hypothetical protein
LVAREFECPLLIGGVAGHVGFIFPFKRRRTCLRGWCAPLSIQVPGTCRPWRDAAAGFLLGPSLNITMLLVF